MHSDYENRSCVPILLSLRVFCGTGSAAEVVLRRLRCGMMFENEESRRIRVQLMTYFRALFSNIRVQFPYSRALFPYFPGRLMKGTESGCTLDLVFLKHVSETKTWSSQNGVYSHAKGGGFSSPCRCRPAVGSSPSCVQWMPLVKLSECEADHSPPSSVKVDNAWSVFSSLYAFLAWCLSTRTT
jgi:hypothetical protein